MTGPDVTVAQVLGWHPEALGAQADDWLRQAGALREHLDTQARALDGSHDTLRGGAGEAVRDTYRHLHDEALGVLRALSVGHEAARTAQSNLTAAQSMLQRATRAAETSGLRVTAQGACTIPERMKQALYASVNADETEYNTAVAALQIDARAQTVAVQRALHAAAEADAEAVAAIENAFADLPVDESFGTARVPATEPKMPPATDSPLDNRTWWDSLTAQDKSLLVDDRPELVGGLDGLSAHVRDIANRRLLQLEHLRLERSAALAPDDPDAAAPEEDRHRLADLDAVRRALDEHPGSRLLLLDTRSGRQVRAAVSVGDPDAADHMSVTTPGIGANLRDSIEGMLDEAGHLRAEAERQLRAAHRGDESVAAIAWVGYDAPQKTYGDLDIANAVFEARAAEAAPSLARFYEGLAVAGTTIEPHITALGHSYGGLTTSLALQADGQAVRDAVFYGSPGLGGRVPSMPNPWLVHTPLGGLNDAVGSAADLGLADGHVYQMTETDDPIADCNRFGRSPHHLTWVTPLNTDPIVDDGRVYSGAAGHAEYPRIDPRTGLLHRSGYNLAAVVAGLPENARR